MSDYLFLSSLVKSNIASPLKFYDPVSIPNQKNPFFNNYKNFFLDKLSENDIYIVYTTSAYYQNVLNEIFFLKKNCMKSLKINLILTKNIISDCLDRPRKN